MAAGEKVLTAAPGAHAGAPLSPQAARLAAWALYLIVFTSGGVLMGVEIAGSRVLAPSFGTSIFVWGSLIGLFMGAMALGYYLGGALADRKPSFLLLATIVSLAGAYIFLVIPYLGPWMCEDIGRFVTHRALGPLLASTVLYFVPSFLLAMVSPFAVKLHAESLAGLGGVAGKLYALSTTGSIVGTLLTTFALIPLFRVTNVLMGLGVCLLVVAVAGLICFVRAMQSHTAADRRGAAVIALVALGCVEAWVVHPIQPQVTRGERLLCYEESSYHDIAVTENVMAGERRLLQPEEIRRWLKFNENTESGIYPYLGKYLNAVTYTDVLHLALIWAPQPKRLLVVGGGGGVVPTQFRLFYPSLERIDVLELDPAVERLCLRYFQAANRGLDFRIGDGRMSLQALEGPYDIIVLDAYSAGGQIPFHLLTWEFLKEAKQKLAPHGVLITNIIAGLENEDPPDERPADLFFAECRTLRASEAEAHGLPHPTLEQQAPLFKQLYVIPKVRENEGGLRGSETVYRNVLVFATLEDRALTRDQLVEKTKAFAGAQPLDRRIEPRILLWHAEHLYERGPRPQELASVPILCDDYAPVETMYRLVKRDEGTWRDY